MVKQLVMAALLACAVGAPGPIQAQVAVGIRGGLRWSGIRGEQETDRGMGIVAGGYIGFGLADQLALQFEINYGDRSFSGLQIGDNALDASAPPAEIDMRYVEVPVLFRVGFPGETLLPSFFAGPYAGFLVGCDIQPEGAAKRSCDESDQPEWFSPRSTDLGIAFGTGLDVALGNGSIFVDVRYALGLLSIQSDDAISAEHGGLDVSGGFAFPLGH